MEELNLERRKSGFGEGHQMIILVIPHGEADLQLRELMPGREPGGGERAILDGIKCEIVARALLRRAEELVVTQESDFWEEQRREEREQGEEPKP
jgi:hypothetical protein